MSTYWCRLKHIHVIKLRHHGITTTSHCLSQWWLISNWTVRNKIQWDLNQNSMVFSQVNAFQKVVCKIPAIFAHLIVFITIESQFKSIQILCCNSVKRVKGDFLFALEPKSLNPNGPNPRSRHIWSILENHGTDLLLIERPNSRSTDIVVQNRYIHTSRWVSSLIKI